MFNYFNKLIFRRQSHCELNKSLAYLSNLGIKQISALNEF